MTTGIAVREALKLAISMTLFFSLALTMNWADASTGGLAIILVSMGSTGASLQKGLMRIVGTTAGLAAGLFAVGVFGQDPAGMLLFQMAILTFVADVLRPRSQRSSTLTANRLSTAPGARPVVSSVLPG